VSLLARLRECLMALISCTECGQQISDKAAACPRCGSPASTSSKHCLMGFKDFLHKFVSQHHPREDRARLLLRLHQIFLTKFANWRNLRTKASFHLRNLKPRRPNCSANFNARLGTGIVSYQSLIPPARGGRPGARFFRYHIPAESV
jgi:hypothetical protein